MMCSVWQLRQESSALVVPAGTRQRLVEPQRAQIHSAVISVAGGVIAS
jgi:hypothetical protein